MRLYSVLIFDEDYNVIHSYHNLNDFFILFRSSIQKEIENVVKSVIEEANINTTYIIEQKINSTDLVVYGSTYMSYSEDKNFGRVLYIVVITDKKYPPLTAKQLLYMLNQKPQLTKELFNQYQDPSSVDKISKLKNELDDTKKIISKTVDELINRGDSIDILMEKAESL